MGSATRIAAVDVHSHGVPPALLEHLRGDGSRFGVKITGSEDPVLTFAGAPPLRPVPRGMSDMTKRLAWMDRSGIGVQFVAPWLDIIGSDLEPVLGQRWVSLLNDTLAAWCEQSAGRVLGLASVHPSDPDVACAELQRATRELGCVGAVLPTHSRYGPLRIDGWERLWSVLEEERIPALIHPPVQGPTSLGGEASLAFRSLWGRAMDTTVVAADLVLEGLFERFPRVALILAEGGGYLPYQAGRLDAQVAIGRVSTRVSSGSHSAHVGRFHFDTTLLAREAIAMLVDMCGSSRVLLGTDYPFFVTAAEPRGEIEAAQLTPEATARILSSTADELFPAAPRGRPGHPTTG